MRLRRVWVLHAAVGLSLAGIAAPMGAVAADSSPPQLVDVQLSADSVDASGFQVVAVEIRLHLSDDVGVARVNGGEANGFPNYPFAVLTQTTAGAGQAGPRLGTSAFALQSGTAQDGWWAATLRLTSGYDGGWTVTDVGVTDNAHDVDIDPRTQNITRTLTVHGAHIPHLSMRQSPDPLVGNPRDEPPVTFYGHLTDTETGAALRASVHMGFEYECNGDAGRFGGTHSVTTGADGSWQLTLDYWVPGYGCASVYNIVHTPDPDNPSQLDAVQVWYVYLSVSPRYRWPVGAALASTVIRLGQSTAVNGTTGAVGEVVRLQRLVSGAWRTVGSATVHTSGRFTLVAEPPGRGRFSYRVLLVPTIRGELASSSHVVYLTVS